MLLSINKADLIEKKRIHKYYVMKNLSDTDWRIIKPYQCNLIIECQLASGLLEIYFETLRYLESAHGYKSCYSLKAIWGISQQLKVYCLRLINP